MRKVQLVRPVIGLLLTAMLLFGPMAMVAQASAPGVGHGDPSGKISPELRAKQASNPNGTARVILQLKSSDSRGASTAAEKAERKAKQKLDQNGGQETRGLGIIAGASGKINLNRLAALSRDPDVLHISEDSRVGLMGSPYGGEEVDFTQALNATSVWALGHTGAGVTVAVIDSGVRPEQPGVEGSQIIASVDLVSGSGLPDDPGGHGSHVAGIVAGRGTDWSGVAPGAKIASVRVIDGSGTAYKSTIVRGIQWAIQNRKAYNIRVINLSLGAPATTSYINDPMAGAVEVAWRVGIVVVASAGNRGPSAGTISTPGFDPYVITVGAMDMSTTVDRRDDVLAEFSSRGPTIDGLTKPDVVAPGRKMLSSRINQSYLDQILPDRVVQEDFFRLSGTSQAAGAVSGVVALMLSANPALTPDSVKAQLMGTTSKPSVYDASSMGAGYVDALAAVKSTARGRQGGRPADSFAATVLPVIKGVSPLTWKSLTYNKGVDSRGVSWSNVTWDNVAWDNVTWDNVAWDNVAWDNVAWDNVAWDNVTWDNVTWDSSGGWDSAGWESIAHFD